MISHVRSGALMIPYVRTQRAARQIAQQLSDTVPCETWAQITDIGTAQVTVLRQITDTIRAIIAPYGRDVEF
jgi:hypothetical protein